ncbi:hypothetical protein DPMN_001285 [Dreissena polymorpha]|uniref:Uncharacterized protein n=1 Tax=Dreissena polymorpha TaxID=45954 RepID=A0A9D4MKN3_DREPO|nr:hypothetical protein DPMN_001285 [Dreissena polymorpha]
MNLMTKFHEDRTVNVASKVLEINVASREKCPVPGGHVFNATKTIFELIQDIIGTNLLTKFHDDRKINVTPRVLTRKIALPLWPYIIEMNLLTKFHEDRTINVASREKCIETNLLTKFHEDLEINVASRVLARVNKANVDVAQQTTDNAPRTKGDHKS